MYCYCDYYILKMAMYEKNAEPRVMSSEKL